MRTTCGQAIEGIEVSGVEGPAAPLASSEDLAEQSLGAVQVALPLGDEPQKLLVPRG